MNAVVQSIWGDLAKSFRAAQWQFADVNRLQAFLKATLNRFISTRSKRSPYSVRSVAPLCHAPPGRESCASQGPGPQRHHEGGPWLAGTASS